MYADDIRYSSKKLLVSSILVMLILLTISPVVNSEAYFDNVSLTANFPTGEKELHLLRVEHVLVLNAADDTNTFNLRYVFPPDYQYQVPIFLEILEDSTANILHYQIEDDVNEPNKVVNFTIGYMEKGESVLIHFSCWVLVKNHEYGDLPEYVKFPKKYELPEETKIWLSPTEVVQANSFLIKYKASQLKGESDNLINFTSVIAPFIKEHRYLLFVLQLNLGIFFSQDAITTLLINGENVGRSHLACALLRSNNVPARVLLANNDQGFWTQMHYMLEYYCPGYGWILIDPTKGTTPYEPKRQVISRVCYPVDEDNTKTDYIFSLMKGEERWMWIDNENVYPYYVDCNEGSKSKMFSENEVTTDSFTADYTFLLTQLVFHQYEQCLGGNLVGENIKHFQNATNYQKQAVSELSKSDDILEYIYLMDKAYDEYKEINL
ncbi:MAG: transglutaminase domain-containing protein [Thermoplasmatales archaeon]|nr:transglutaminase domain-containing protein [Thermoplasmatales archaeon]